MWKEIGENTQNNNIKLVHFALLTSGVVGLIMNTSINKEAMSWDTRVKFMW